jgi:hypothetical protein
MAKKKVYSSNSGAFYGLGIIGALVYYLQQANTLGQGVMGVLKAILWPAFFVYRIYQYLGM